MKIASLVPYQIMPAKMGGQKGIYLFLKYLGEHCSIICYTTEANEPGNDENFQTKKILSNKKYRYFNPFYFFKLKKELKKEGITHLILEQPYYGWLAFLLRKSLNIQLILHSHNIEALRFKSTGKWWWRIMASYEKWIHRKADFNFFISAEDEQYAISTFRLNKEKTAIITYGIEKNTSPQTKQKDTAKKDIKRKHTIKDNTTILLFNGTLDYLPNRMALDEILLRINPLLLKEEQHFPYIVLVCGNRLPKEYNLLKEYTHKNIIYAGFVDDIESYFLAADIFLNPVTEGGGIKTKLVESLAAGCSAVSYTTGAIGVPSNIVDKKMSIVNDSDAISFTKAILSKKESEYIATPESFYEHFYWGNIAKKAFGYLTELE